VLFAGRGSKGKMPGFCSTDALRAVISLLRFLKEITSFHIVKALRATCPCTCAQFIDIIVSGMHRRFALLTDLTRILPHRLYHKLVIEHLQALTRTLQQLWAIRHQQQAVSSQ